MSEKHRSPSIDVLRAIALMGLISAHIQPTGWIMQFRSFDVPMMVFLSGVSYSMSKAVDTSFPSYILQRFIRIIIPTWFFLVLYFYVFQEQSMIVTIAKFTLLTSWYVWIMRVFFIIALFAPFVFRKLNSYSDRQICVLFICALIINELLCRYFAQTGNPEALSTMVIMNFAYIMVFGFGCQITQFRDSHVYGIGIVSLFAFICLSTYYYNKVGCYLPTQTMKYPPHAYYLLYAVTWIVLLWMFRNAIVRFLERCRIVSLFIFIGSHTMWIYFYHIIILDFLPTLDIFLLRFCFVIFLSTMITYLQHIVIAYAIEKLPVQMRKPLRMIFDG